VRSLAGVVKTGTKPLEAPEHVQPLTTVCMAAEGGTGTHAVTL